MKMRIIVPLDGSALAEAALPWARSLATRDTEHISLLSVIEVPTEFATWVTSEEFLEQPEMADIVSERRQYLQDQAARFELDSADIVVRVGTPARKILAYVSESDDSSPLVVMSTHGYGGIKRLAFGSVALQIIHNYKGPIMTVREDAAAEEPGLERLLIPVDGSDFSAVAVGRAMEILGEPYPTAHLVRVLAAPSWAVRSINHGLVAEYLEASREWACEQLDELREKATAAGYEVTTELRPHGHVVEEILAAAETSRADAIAMCTHGLGGVGRIVLGSVADGVLRHSNRPVLLLRPDSR